jgi:signal transduction histidine kinase
MTQQDEPTHEQLVRRLARERNARRQAEGIAEETTSRLFSAGEELRSLNQAMRDFVAIAAHDLRSPLTSISGFASLLNSDWESFTEEERRRYIGIIEGSADSLIRLAEDLLTVSRIEAGALDTNAQVIELDGAVREAMQTFRDHASQISVRIDRDLRISADPTHVERILVNVLGNALKYGKAPIEIDAGACDAWVEIRVRDHGDGVPEDFVPRLFGRFARAGTSSGATPGTGLGLAIVRGLAEANGGNVWYEKNEPHGSCFAVRLPQAA